MERIKIVALDGAVRSDSNSRKLLVRTVEAFDPAQTEIELLDQSRLQLPLYNDTPELKQNSGVQKLIAAVSRADAIVLSSPEYHGSMSGALKNALDWCTLLEGQFRGKVVGLIGGGGSLANSGANIQMMMAIRAMHGWLMPDVILSVTNIWDAFDAEGRILDPSIQLRVRSFVDHLTHYGEVFREQRASFSVAA